MNLADFLSLKGAEYAAFEPKRFIDIYENLKFHIKSSARFIHIIGSNGKGSTGRFLAMGLAQNGLKVLHFSSPHILNFRERFYRADIAGQSGVKLQDSTQELQNFMPDSIFDFILDGCVSAEELESAHNFLQQFDLAKKASYFEYATLLCVVLSKECDFVVLECGLGGEFDSTNAIDSECCIFTPIGMDHMEFLGDSIEKIATTKLNAMKKVAFLAPQRYIQTLSIAREIAKNKNAKLVEVAQNLRDCKEFSKLYLDELDSYARRYPLFLQQNLKVATMCLAHLGYRFDFKTLEPLSLVGRAQKIAKNIMIDVGHNVECAKVLAQSITQMLGDKKIILIYNSYKDKDIRAILSEFLPVVKKVLIISANNFRICPTEDIKAILSDLSIPNDRFSMEQILNDEFYLVFGSFSVVEAFLTSFL